jgi:hypothetical protein
MPGGEWRLWYNDERDNKSIRYAVSTNFHMWSDRGKVIGDEAGEGPKVFRWRDRYWMITDVWKGLAAYRSKDAVNWERQPGGNLLAQPGRGRDDGVKGQHADVIVNGKRAYLFYFTHPDAPAAPRRSSIQVVELKLRDGWLTADRDAPTRISLKAPRCSR